MALLTAEWLSEPNRRTLWRSRAFWIAFFVTLTETVGAGCIALPIAFARVPTSLTIAILVGVGCVNIVTVAALVDAVCGNESMRAGTGYFGNLVRDTLGAGARRILNPALMLLNLAGIAAAHIGFGSVMSGVTGVPAVWWGAGLLAVDLLVLARRSFDVTAAAAMTIGVLNLALLATIIVIAFLHPGTSGAPAGSAGAGALGSVFGISMTVYFGHTSAVSSAKTVLDREPSGRALLAGNVAAMATAVLIYVVMVVATRHVVPARELADFAGTALTPMARRLGVVVRVSGVLFAVLALGIGSVHYSVSVFNQMVERREQQVARSRRLEHMRAVAPIIATSVAVAGLQAAGRIAFTTPIAIVGTLTLPLLGGVVPMLMVLRRSGHAGPGARRSLLRTPAVVGAVSSVFFVGTLAHALWIWTNPVARLGALATAAFIPHLVLRTRPRGARSSVVSARWARLSTAMSVLLVATVGVALVVRRPIDVDASPTALAASAAEAPRGLSQTAADEQTGISPTVDTRVRGNDAGQVRVADTHRATSTPAAGAISAASPIGAAGETAGTAAAAPSRVPSATLTDDAGPPTTVAVGLVRSPSSVGPAPDGASVTLTSITEVIPSTAPAATTAPSVPADRAEPLVPEPSTTTSVPEGSAPSESSVPDRSAPPESSVPDRTGPPDSSVPDRSAPSESSVPPSTRG